MAEDEPRAVMHSIVSHVDIFDLEKGESVVQQIASPLFSNIHDLERDEDVLLAQAMLEELKMPRVIMDEMDREFGHRGLFSPSCEGECRVFKQKAESGER